MKKLLLSISAIVATASTCIAQISSSETTTVCYGQQTKLTVQGKIETTLEAGNGQDGVMFDLVAKNNIIVDSLEYNADDAGGQTTIEVFYRTGSHVDYTLTADG